MNEGEYHKYLLRLTREELIQILLSHNKVRNLQKKISDSMSRPQSVSNKETDEQKILRYGVL